MEMRNLFGGALVGALMLATNFWSCPANALTFQFSFFNGVGNDPAQSLVQGIISGLQDNQPNQAATSVRVTSNPAGFGLGEYVPNPLLNSFTVGGGILTLVVFESFAAAMSPIGCCSLGLLPDGSAGL